MVFFETAVFPTGPLAVYFFRDFFDRGPGLSPDLPFMVFFKSGLLGPLGCLRLSWCFSMEADFGFLGLGPFMVFLKVGCFHASLGSGCLPPLMVFWSGGYPDTLIFVLGHFSFSGIFRSPGICLILGRDTTSAWRWL